MSSNITNISRIDGGWNYTLDTAPANGWDIWLNAVRLETQYTSTQYLHYTSSKTPPPIEVIDPYEDTASGIAASTARLQWQHVGATYYIVERSSDGVTYARVGVIPGAGNVWHTFTIAATNGATYWRVYAADLDETGYYKTSYALPCAADQSTIPTVPQASISVTAGTATIASLAEIDLDGSVTDADIPGGITYGGTVEDAGDLL